MIPGTTPDLDLDTYLRHWHDVDYWLHRGVGLACWMPLSSYRPSPRQRAAHKARKPLPLVSALALMGWAR